MIQVDALSKLYGSIRAVDRISFAVGRGEVVGFLGPNGAGKTTSMRMLTTYLPPTRGRALMAGHDVLDEPLEVRKKIGYLPENVPLPSEMRVREYLDFRARLKDVPRRARRLAVERVIDRCFIRDVETRVTGQLSRGYRQRVGLAEALVHDPEILILDEPTAGLDPIQVREVRSLIRELGEAHTILLSTHVMPEVEAVCGRVLLLVGGKLVVDESLDHLRAGRAIELEVRGPVDAVRRAIESTPNVGRVAIKEREGDRGAVFEIQARGGDELREELARRMIQNGWGLRRLNPMRTSLEEKFVEAVRNAGGVGVDSSTEAA